MARAKVQGRTGDSDSSTRRLARIAAELRPRARREAARL